MTKILCLTGIYLYGCWTAGFARHTDLHSLSKDVWVHKTWNWKWCCSCSLVSCSLTTLPNILFLHFSAFITCSHYSCCCLVKISIQFFKTATEHLIKLVYASGMFDAPHMIRVLCWHDPSVPRRSSYKPFNKMQRFMRDTTCITIKCRIHRSHTQLGAMPSRPCSPTFIISTLQIISATAPKES